MAVVRNVTGPVFHGNLGSVGMRLPVGEEVTIRDREVILLQSYIDSGKIVLVTKSTEDAVGEHETVLLSGIRPFEGHQSMGGFRLTSVGTPSADTDAVNKAFVVLHEYGLDLKGSVRVATAAALPNNTLAANVLTADANGALNDVGIDGVTTLAVSDRVLVQDEVSGLKNGIYTITTLGAADAKWTMTRAADANESVEVTPGMFMYVEAGTANLKQWFVLTTAAPITLNTTALVFQQFDVSVVAHSLLSSGIHGAGTDTLATDADITTHAALTTNAHGMSGSALAGVDDITTHAALTTNAHGMSGSALAGVDDITTHAALTTNAHGMSGSALAGVDDITTHAALTTNAHGMSGSALAGVDDITTHAALTTNAHGMSGSALAGVDDITTHAALTTNAHGMSGSALAGVDDITTHSGLVSGCHGIGATGAIAGTIGAVDLEITDATKGIILKSATGTHRWRLTVSGAGAAVWSDLG